MLSFLRSGLKENNPGCGINYDLRYRKNRSVHNYFCDIDIVLLLPVAPFLLPGAGTFGIRLQYLIITIKRQGITLPFYYIIQDYFLFTILTLIIPFSTSRFLSVKSLTAVTVLFSPFFVWMPIVKLYADACVYPEGAET